MKTKTIFLWLLLALLVGGVNDTFAFRYVITWHDGNAHQNRNDGGSGNFFDWDSGKHNINPKFANQDNIPSYTDDEYGVFTFSYGLKMESDDDNTTNGTSLNFTITGSSTLTILKSTYYGSSATIKLHNNTTNEDVGTYDGTDTGNGYKEIRIEGLAAGSYSIKRGSGESGLFYVRVTDDADMTMTVHPTDLTYGAYNNGGARITVTDEFAYVEPSTYSYSGNTWLRIKVNFSKALSAVSEVTLSSSNSSVLATDDASKNYIINNTNNLAAYYFVKVVGYSPNPVTITFTHTATNATATKSFTVNPGTMTTYSSYPYKWDFRNNEWTSTRLQTTGDGTNWSVTADEARNKGNISSSTVNMIKGLSFTASENALCLDWKNKLVWMAAGATISIPSLAAGQVITFNGSAGFGAPSGVTRMDENKFYVNTAGNVTFTAPSGGIYLYSIDVSATGQATYHTTSAGVFEFTGNGSLAGGTVIKDVPGIEMTIGKSGETWTVSNENHVGISAICTSNNDHGVNAGTFYKFQPIVSGFLSFTATIWQGHHIRIANESGTILWSFYDNSNTHFTGTEFNYPLQAGETYYIYNTEATTDGSYKMHLHSFSYEPAFLNTARTGRQSAEVPAVFAAVGSTTVFPSILTDANEYVTFAASGGAPDGAITVAANGNGTPTLVTPTTSAYTITATVASPNSSVTSKTASYQLSYSATPITLSFNWNSPCNTNYVENGTYKNDITATAGGDDVTSQIETWTYTSSDPSIATVASDGTLTILNSGMIEITVTATDNQGVYQSATVSYWLTINTTTTPTLTLEKGTTAKTIIYGKETYSNVGSVNVEGPEITYESSDPTIATVNSSGVVTPVKPSTTPVTITVRSSQYKQYAAVELTYNVTVNKGSITLNFIPESVILNQNEKITPYINFSSADKVGVDGKITVTTTDASTASLQNPAYDPHEKIEGDKLKVDGLDVEITAGTFSGSSDQTATVTVTISGSDYYNDVSTTCKVKVRATPQKNFSWDSKDEVPEYTIYQGDFMMVPAIIGNCSQNESYSLASKKMYAKKINYDQSANMEDSKNYRAKEGVPDYLIVNADGSGNAPAANTANSNTYAWILYARSENTRASAYPDSLMVYGKIDAGTADHIVYLRAQDPNNTSYYCDAKIIIKPKSDLDTKVSNDVSGMSFPFTWDFTSISDDDMTLIAEDNVYYESRTKIDKAYTGYHLSTGFMNSQDSYVIKDGDNYRKTPSVEKPSNLYFQNFVVQDGNGGLKTLKPFKGLKISMAQTRYNSKIDRVRIFNDHLYFNGGPTEILLPSVASMPSSFKVFVKLKSNGSRTMFFKQGSGAKVSQSLSGSDEVVSFNATSAGGDITLQFLDCNVYWIAASTEAREAQKKGITTYAAATYCYPEDLDLEKSCLEGVNTGLTAYYASDFSSNTVTLSPITGYVEANTGLILKATKTQDNYLIAKAKNAESYSAPKRFVDTGSGGEGLTNYLKPAPSGTTIKRFVNKNNEAVEYAAEADIQFTNFVLSSQYKQVDDNGSSYVDKPSGYQNSDWMFYRVNGSSTSTKNMSYLQLPNKQGDLDGVSQSSSRRMVDTNNEEHYSLSNLIRIIFADEINNDIETTNISSKSIERKDPDNDGWYTLQGVEVKKPTKGGIYIHKGKKIVLK